MSATYRQTWPCANCGHKHYVTQACPTHKWTDNCPYEGLDCELPRLREGLAQARTERETAIRDCALVLLAQRDGVAEALGLSRDSDMTTLANAITELRARLTKAEKTASEVQKYWRDWPDERRAKVRALSPFLADAIENLAVLVESWRAP